MGRKSRSSPTSPDQKSSPHPTLSLSSLLTQQGISTLYGLCVREKINKVIFMVDPAKSPEERRSLDSKYERESRMRCDRIVYRHHNNLDDVMDEVTDGDEIRLSLPPLSLNATNKNKKQTQTVSRGAQNHVSMENLW